MSANAVLVKYTFICFLFISCLPAILWAQEKRAAIYKGTTADLEVLGRYTLPEDLFDSIASTNTFKGVITALQKDGYLLATIDSVRSLESKIDVYISVGEKYKWAALNPGNLDEGMLSAIGYREKFYQDKVFNYSEVARMLKKVVRFSENNGFPFASIKLDSVVVEDQRIVASLNYQSGPLITFDTVAISGSNKTQPLFISSYLRIKPGMPYEERKVEQANSKLNRLPYLKISGPTRVSFQLKKGTAHFNLSEVKSNQIDGVIGLLPNEGSEGKALLTGQFNLLLNNMFGTGKRVSLKWQRPEVSSQNLDAQYFHPNLLRSSINVEAGFYLLKEDTSFINRNISLAASMLVGSYGNVKVFTDFKVARSISEAVPINDVSGGSYADFNLNQYGIAYEWSNFNNFQLPTKGWAFNFRGAAGNKNIRKSADQDSSYYDSMKMKIAQYDLKASVTNYFPITKRLILKSQLSAGSIIGDHLFINDLYRIGGINSLRGFIENEFFASSYGIGTLETQFFIDAESYFLLFYDQGYIASDLTKFQEQFVTGLGAGLTFSTNAGVFTFVYGLGRTESQPISINFSKIHFGYITRF